MLVADKIEQRLRILFKWKLRNEADKAHENEANKAAKRSSNSYPEQRFTNVDVPKTKQLELESRSNWGFVRAGLHRSDLHGIDTYEIQVLDFLEHGTSSSLLGIFGKHGVGKSTLLRLISTNYLLHHSFEYVFCLELYDGCALSAFQDVLAQNIGLGWPQMSDTGLLAKMISSHLRDKTFLLLLDDLRDGIDMTAIGMPMPLGRQQKVVFTTRDQATCVKMGCGGNSIQMQCLGEDDAWNLFRYYVGDKIINADLEIEDIAKQMVAECRGFPSALCTIGRSMSNQSECWKWRVAYDMLMIKRPRPHDIEEMNEEGYPCLQFLKMNWGTLSYVRLHAIVFEA